VSKPKDKIWLTAADGNNPYQALLKNAKKIFVTSDSINMINEACQSQAPISILANDFIPTPKHLRFIESINNRVTELDSHEKPITIIDNNQHDIISNPFLQSLINSSD
jgi:mitochondrial fission protein ELM1